MEQNKLICRNSMSAKLLVISKNATIDHRVDPNTGKDFFTCGDITGYISPNALKALNEGQDIDAFRYAEVSKDNGQTWIHCLWVDGNQKCSNAKDMSLKYINETIYGEVKVVERGDGAYAVLDKNDNEIVPFGKYAWIDGFDHGLARVRIGYSQNTITVLTLDGPISPWRKWGIINKQGEEVLPVIYDNIWNFKGKNRLSTYVESKERGGEEVFFHDLDNSIPYPKWKYNSHRAYNDDYGTHFGEYEGSYAQDIMGYSDDVINDAFEGDPDAYWNID